MGLPNTPSLKSSNGAKVHINTSSSPSHLETHADLKENQKFETRQKQSIKKSENKFQKPAVFFNISKKLSWLMLPIISSSIHYVL